MDSSHDKVIQSHLVHDGCAIVATFSGFRAASLSGADETQIEASFCAAIKNRKGAEVDLARETR
jgi:hypothetical protein